jgi:hypothetical protein
MEKADSSVVRVRAPSNGLVLLVLLHASLACDAIAGIEQKRCQPSCVDQLVRLSCDASGTPRAEPCASQHGCAQAVACREGSCVFEPKVGASCGASSVAQCNEGYACLGPDLKLTAHEQHTCVLADDGAVWCWGYNQRMQLGDGTTESRGSPVPVQNLPGRMVDISAGYMHTCGLLDDGSAYCWGDNSQGQCGSVATSEPLSAPSKVAAANVRFISVHAARQHTCAVADDFTVYCWGNTSLGQCGVEPSDAGKIVVGPTQIRELGNVLRIQTVSDHTCAVTARAPYLACWGSNQNRGRITHTLGPAAAELPYSARPVPVDLGQPIVDVSMSQATTYAVTRAGGVLAWGWNQYGEVGMGTVDTSTIEVVATPKPVVRDRENGPPLTGVVEVFRSSGHAPCVRVEDSAANAGTPYLCWGLNIYAQVGLGEPTTSETHYPYAVPAKALSASTTKLVLGTNHGCASFVAGAAWQVRCYGLKDLIGGGQIDAAGLVQWSPMPVAWDKGNFSALLP